MCNVRHILPFSNFFILPSYLKEISYANIFKNNFCIIKKVLYNQITLKTNKIKFDLKEMNSNLLIEPTKTCKLFKTRKKKRKSGLENKFLNFMPVV